MTECAEAVYTQVQRPGLSFCLLLSNFCFNQKSNSRPEALLLVLMAKWDCIVQNELCAALMKTRHK